MAKFKKAITYIKEEIKDLKESLSTLSTFQKIISVGSIVLSCFLIRKALEEIKFKYDTHLYSEFLDELQEQLGE